MRSSVSRTPSGSDARYLPRSPTRSRRALLRNARAMIDVDYVRSPLVADCRGTGADTAAEPHPGPTLPRLDAVWRDLPRRACFWT
jgi:hypothetical protein